MFDHLLGRERGRWDMPCATEAQKPVTQPLAILAAVSLLPSSFVLTLYKILS